MLVLLRGSLQLCAFVTQSCDRKCNFIPACCQCILFAFVTLTVISCHSHSDSLSLSQWQISPLSRTSTEKSLLLFYIQENRDLIFMWFWAKFRFLDRTDSLRSLIRSCGERYGSSMLLFDDSERTESPWWCFPWFKRPLGSGRGKKLLQGLTGAICPEGWA